MAMWQAVILTLLLLKGYQGQECSNSLDPVIGLSGQPVLIWPPNTQTELYSVEWKMELRSQRTSTLILRWNNQSEHCSSISERLNCAFVFECGNLSLNIKPAKPQCSGLYKLAMTSNNGDVSCIQFNVSIFDHVEKPYLQIVRKIINEGKCQMDLYCLVSRNDNVNYSWYNGSELILTPRNCSHLEVQIDAHKLNTYTCNISNPASWASASLNLTFTQDCLVIVILGVLFLGTLICFCVWMRKRKRKQSRSSPQEFLTVYEDIQEIKRNQCSASESQSQGNAATLYSVIQVSQARLKKNQDPSCSSTIYEQVGRRPLKACNPARLSRKELETFEIHF
ncbi:natural killer cell receptor 2B4 isoform X2 [Cavia porcellus]|uniref:natural killer cell receptor 2B4 isoform X2 n=1 Tax=Cavia porcellus TaxID=10141 RepID=UPI002FE31B37